MPKQTDYVYYISQHQINGIIPFELIELFIEICRKGIYIANNFKRFD